MGTVRNFFTFRETFHSEEFLTEAGNNVQQGDKFALINLKK